MASRTRIGLLIPSTNTTCEADFQLVLPRGFTVHGQRLWLTNDAQGDESMLRMNAEIETGARYLATAGTPAVFSMSAIISRSHPGPLKKLPVVQPYEIASTCAVAR